MSGNDLLLGRRVGNCCRSRRRQCRVAFSVEYTRLGILGNKLSHGWSTVLLRLQWEARFGVRKGREGNSRMSQEGTSPSSMRVHEARE